jgi:hypothetical protein
MGHRNIKSDNSSAETVNKTIRCAMVLRLAVPRFVLGKEAGLVHDVLKRAHNEVVAVNDRFLDDGAIAEVGKCITIGDDTFFATRTFHLRIAKRSTNANESSASDFLVRKLQISFR